MRAGSYLVSRNK